MQCVQAIADRPAVAGRRFLMVVVARPSFEYHLDRLGRETVANLQPAMSRVGNGGRRALAE
jgi:hypothetical protein